MNSRGDQGNVSLDISSNLPPLLHSVCLKQWNAQFKPSNPFFVSLMEKVMSEISNNSLREATERKAEGTATWAVDKNTDLKPN